MSGHAGNAGGVSGGFFDELPGKTAAVRSFGEDWLALTSASDYGKAVPAARSSTTRALGFTFINICAVPARMPIMTTPFATLRLAAETVRDVTLKATFAPQ